MAWTDKITKSQKRLIEGLLRAYSVTLSELTFITLHKSVNSFDKVSFGDARELIGTANCGWKRDELHKYCMGRRQSNV